MKEERKAKNKKKILLYYLVLAACLLVIAAVTVTVIFTVGAPKSPQLIDSNQPSPDDNKDPDDGNNPGNDTPTVVETGYKLPVSGELTYGYEFGWQPSYTQYCMHLGLDFAGNVGDEVCAVLDGEVVDLARASTIGEVFITLKHADGNTSTYTYVDAKDTLKVGSKVKRGEVIGTIAPAGGFESEKGVHLHLEFKDAQGNEFDPSTELYDRK